MKPSKPSLAIIATLAAALNMGCALPVDPADNSSPEAATAASWQEKKLVNQGSIRAACAPAGFDPFHKEQISNSDQGMGSTDSNPKPNIGNTGDNPSSQVQTPTLEVVDVVQMVLSCPSAPLGVRQEIVMLGVQSDEVLRCDTLEKGIVRAWNKGGPLGLDVVQLVDSDDQTIFEVDKKPGSNPPQPWGTLDASCKSLLSPVTLPGLGGQGSGKTP